MNFYQGFIQYKNYKLILFYTLLISIIIQLIALIQIILLYNLMQEEPLSIFEHLVLIPLGLIATALPISPAGLGIGHAAFESLYNVFERSGGANVFNLFILIQIFVFLFGVIPFLMNKQEKQNLKNRSMFHMKQFK